MRQAFFDDLRRRMDKLESLAEQLSGAEGGAVRAAVLAQLHDIKGCGAPYGVPEASELARCYENDLSRFDMTPAQLEAQIIEILAAFRRLIP